MSLNIKAIERTQSTAGLLTGIMHRAKLPKQENTTGIQQNEHMDEDKVRLANFINLVSFEHLQKHTSHRNVHGYQRIESSEQVNTTGTQQNEDAEKHKAELHGVLLEIVNKEQTKHRSHRAAHCYKRRLQQKYDRNSTP